MPGYSNIPVSAGSDMTSRATYLELMGAWNERRQAVGDAPITDPAVGDNAFEVAAAYSIAEMQNWVETKCPNFVVSHDAGGPPTLRAAGYYDTKTSVDFYTLASLRSTAGLNASGFKKTAAPAYGLAAVGDNVLIEHFNELRLAFNVLRWTGPSGTFDTHSENNYATAQSGFKTTWNLAYADALAAWPGSIINASNNPQAICVGEQTDTSPAFRCTLFRGYQYGEFSLIATHIAHSMEVYQRTHLPQYVADAEVYDDNGDDVTSGNLFQSGKYRLIQTFASATTATRTTHKIGQDPAIAAAPNQGPAPAAPPPTETRQSLQGWEATPPARTGSEFPIGVIKWNMVYT